MQQLPRYVLFELLKVFSVVLAGMTSMILLVGVLKEAVTQGLGFSQIVMILPYVLPEALKFAVPAAILFAACSVYGRMASSNEVVALKSLGISPLTIIWPMIVLAVLLSFGSVWLNDLAISWGRDGLQRVIIESVDDILLGMLRTQRSYSTRQFSISVKKVEGRTLVFPTLTFQATETSPQVTIIAERAEVHCDPAQNALVFNFFNGTISVGDSVSMVFPDWLERAVPLPDASRKATGGYVPWNQPLRQIPEEVAKLRSGIRTLEQQLAAQAAYQMMTGDFAELTGAKWPSARQQLINERSKLYRVQAEPHRRWANGFSCLCFVLVGAPLAMRLRNSDFITSFFACFMPILLFYYPLLAYGLDRSKSGAMPPISVWMGNLILAIISFWWFRKILRY